MNKSSVIFFLLFLFFALPGFSQQATFSLATDLDLQRSMKKEQQYWAVGQSVVCHFNFKPTDGAYVWISYYSNGKFKNDIAANAKQPATNPQQINYINNAEMRFKQFSVGWKHYFKGSFDVEQGWNLYGYAGFGLLLGRVINTPSIFIDTSLYSISVRSGKANFKRLTLDLGLGWEVPLGADLYFYTEARAWVPTTDYPSKYLFINKNAPFVASLNIGVRILFNYNTD